MKPARLYKFLEMFFMSYTYRMESAGLFKNIFGKSSPVPVTGVEKITSMRYYRCFRDYIDESLKVYLDYTGQKFVPLVVGDVKWFVSEEYLLETTTELLDGVDPMLRQYVLKPDPVIRFQEFYVGEIPHYLQVVFELHGVKFVTFEWNRCTYQVWDERYDQVCRRICDSARQSIRQTQLTPETITRQVTNVTIADFYRDDDHWEYTRAYLTLLGIRFARVVHQQQTYYIPLSHLELATRRLNLYV